MTDFEKRIAELEAEVDEARSLLATTADRLNVALREIGCTDMIGDVYHSLAIRDGIVALYDKGARWRQDCHEARAEVERLNAENEQLSAGLDPDVELLREQRDDARASAQALQELNDRLNEEVVEMRAEVERLLIRVRGEQDA